MLEKNDFAILKGENDRLMAELEKVKNQMRDEVSKLQVSSLERRFPTFLIYLIVALGKLQTRYES